MKRLLPLLFCTFLLWSCNEDDVTRLEEVNNPNFRVSESSMNLQASRSSLNEPCMTVDLIAGQHEIAGSVSVDRDGDNLMIIYTATNGWTIHATHLSIGNCDEQTIPTTGSGNPKIGRFEHSTSHADGVTTVTYTLDAAVLDENYCFAAHAEVSSETGNGETAWASGTPFDGNNWAMFVEALLSDCDVDGEEPPVTK